MKKFFKFIFFIASLLIFEIDSNLQAKDLYNTINFFQNDSLKTFSENEVGLSVVFPTSWVLLDTRKINPTLREFAGIILVDTLNNRNSPHIFIMLDNEGVEYEKNKFLKSFEMSDTSINAFQSEPSALGNLITTFRYYIITEITKIIVQVDIKPEDITQYKPIVESIIKTIKITPPQ